MLRVPVTHDEDLLIRRLAELAEEDSVSSYVRKLIRRDARKRGLNGNGAE